MNSIKANLISFNLPTLIISTLLCLGPSTLTWAATPAEIKQELTSILDNMAKDYQKAGGDNNYLIYNTIPPQQLAQGQSLSTGIPHDGPTIPFIDAPYAVSKLFHQTSIFEKEQLSLALGDCAFTWKGAYGVHIGHVARAELSDKYAGQLMSFLSKYENQGVSVSMVEYYVRTWGYHPLAAGSDMINSHCSLHFTLGKKNETSSNSNQQSASEVIAVDSHSVD